MENNPVCVCQVGIEVSRCAYADTGNHLDVRPTGAQQRTGRVPVPVCDFQLTSGQPSLKAGLHVRRKHKHKRIA